MSMLNEVRPADAVKRDRSFTGRLKEIIPWKGDDVKEIIRKVVYISAVAVLIFSAYNAVEYEFGSTEMWEDNDYLSSLSHNSSTDASSGDTSVNTPADDGNQGDNAGAILPTDDSSEQPEQADDPVDSKYPAGMLDRFKALYDINPDIIGWLTIDGLANDKGENYIDYPVMQTTDNDYYLNHDFLRTEKSYGALFADYHVKITKDSGPQNTIIYGHNMGAGTFFSHLHDYKKRASVVSENRIITFSTLYEENDYIIIGCFLTGIREDQDNIPVFRYHLIFDFEDITDFDYWYQNVLYRNYYITDIDCNENDEYLTLSTCSTEIADSRFVVIARKLREGEDPSVYNYYSNPDVRKPAAFYIAYDMDIPDDDGPNYKYYGKEETATTESEGIENNDE